MNAKNLYLFGVIAACAVIGIFLYGKDHNIIIGTRTTAIILFVIAGLTTMFLAYKIINYFVSGMTPANTKKLAIGLLLGVVCVLVIYIVFGLFNLQNETEKIFKKDTTTNTNDNGTTKKEYLPCNHQKTIDSLSELLKTKKPCIVRVQCNHKSQKTTRVKPIWETQN